MKMFTLAGIRNGLWCVLAFAIVACASAPLPTEKLEIARTSIARAEQAQAAQFAQVELDQARDKLAAAQAAIDKRDAEAASRMADQADVDAQLAESTARARQEEQRADDMDASLRDLRTQTLKRKPTTE
jgi:septal ring factor EnvC (AmiA/AmiB activator)